MSTRSLFEHRGIGWALCLGLLFVAGCDEEGSDATSPGGVNVRLETLTASTALVYPGDSTCVSARVVTGDATPQPAAGVLVTFGEAGHRVRGVFDPAAALTDTLGWAHSVYRPMVGDSARVDVKATVGAQVRYLTLLVRRPVAEDAELSVLVTASESSLPADGHSESDLRVTVTGSGQPLAGRSVRLVAGELFEDLDRDGRFSTGDELLLDANENGLWDAIGEVTSPVATDANGVALATYTAGTVPGDVYIKASVDSVGSDLPLRLHSEQSNVAVLADPIESWADGLTPVTVQVRVSDSNDLPLGGKLVRFTAGEPFEDHDGDGYYTSGTDDFSDTNANGVWDAFGTIASSATTNAQGTAQVTLIAGHQAGTVTLYASTRESRGSTTLRLLDLPRVVRAEWGWSSDWLYANGASMATLTLQVYDVNGSPIPGKGVQLVAGEPFEDTNGNGVYDPGTDTLGPEVIENGSWDALGAIEALVYADATGTIHIPYTAPTVAGNAEVKAWADGYAVDAPIELRALPELLTIELYIDREQICLLGSGGEDRATITGRGIALDGLPAPAGVPLAFTIESGPAGGEMFEGSNDRANTLLTDGQGEARAVLRAGSLPGAVRVIASRGGVSRSIDVGISVGPVTQLTARAQDYDLNSWEQTVIDVSARDAFNNPSQDGTLVYFETDEGLVQGTAGGATSRTVDGQAQATYYSLGPEAQGDGVAEITVRAQPSGVTTTVSVNIPVAVPTVRLMDAASSNTELSVRGVGETDHAVLTARCYSEPGVPAPAGLPVSFEIVSSPGNEETIDDERGPVTVETNGSGIATALLRSGTRSGPVHVQVGSGTIQKDLYLGVSAGPPAGVYCWADPAQATAPRDTIEVYAVVDDAYNNPVADGTIVYFGADLGFIYTENGSGTAATDAGVAQATYVALLPDGNTATEALVTCSVAGSIACETAIALPVEDDPLPPGAIARIELVPSLTEIAVRGTGWTEQCAIVASAFDAQSQPVGSGRAITFEILDGPGGGESIENDGYGPVTALTDGNGQARVTLSSGTVSGTVRLEASVSGLATRAALVSIAAGPAVRIAIGVDPLNIRGWDVVGAEAGVIAIVSDTYNNPVSNGTTIYFTCDEGVIRGWDGNLGSAVTEGGLARATYLSGLPRLDGRVMITASTAGGAVLGQGALISSGPPTSLEFVSPTPPVTIPADGESELQVMVEVLDVNGNFVVGGTQIEFRTSQGTIDESATTADGVYGSLAEADLRSETLDRDFSWSVPDDGIGAVAQVTARAGLGGGVSDVLEVAFGTGPAYRGNSRIDLATSVPAGSATPFEILVRDRYGNPLGGHVIGLSVTGGGSVTASGTTDAWGTAGPLVFSAPAVDTTCVITAIDNDPSYGGMTLSTTVTVQ